MVVLKKDPGLEAQHAPRVANVGAQLFGHVTQGPKHRREALHVHPEKRILIVDDVADTGHTLALVRDTSLAQVAEVRSAVLYQKPQSTVDCEYVWRHTARWINFPWSTEPPVVDLSAAGRAVLDA